MRGIGEPFDRFVEHTWPGGSLTALKRMTGGASRETWSFDVTFTDGRAPLGLVLRRDPSTNTVSMGRGVEARLLDATGAAGVPVPGVRAVLEPEDDLGDGFVMDRVEGETIARKILRDDEFAGARNLLTGQCAAALAAIHRADTAALPAIPSPSSGSHPAEAQLRQFRNLLDGFGEAQPALELGLRWLADHLPPSPDHLALVHGDFRMGNLIVGPDGLRSVIDWELTHLGDPIEDLGWFCVKAWRFGSDLPAGGVGTREELLAGYAKESGVDVDPEVLRFWEAYGTFRWGCICLVQTFTHLGGAHRSVELAAVGRRVAETEYDLLKLIA